jgi:ABC-type glycerol-3-phosphate transport system substrate-binding protein
MKRMTIMLTAMFLQILLPGCVSSEASIESAEIVSVSTETEGDEAASDGDYVIPATWVDNSVNDGTTGYIVSALGLSSNEYELYPGYLETGIRADGILSITQYDYQGGELRQANIPAPETGASYTPLFVNDGIWILKNVFQVTNDETGETEVSCCLIKYDDHGTVLAEADGAMLENVIPSELVQASNGELLLNCDDRVLFFGSEGEYLATLDSPGAWFQICKDYSGRTYLMDITENVLYTVDWENHLLGQQVYASAESGRFYPGSPTYDFYFKTGSRLYGVSLERGERAELLCWADWGISMPDTVCYFDETSLLISIEDYLMGTELLIMQNVPAEDIPEKTVVKLVVGMDASYRSWMTEADAVGENLSAAISSYNIASNQYQIELLSFASQDELQTMLLSEESPDLILWSDYFSETISLSALAGKGYLLDLEALMDQDETLAASDFIPAILDLEKAYSSGLYVMPTAFSYDFLIGLPEYVGDTTGWSVEDFFQAVSDMPDGMEVIGATTQEEALSMLLDGMLDLFVDKAAGTCSFTDERFETLLTICRDYFDAEIAEDDQYAEEFDAAEGLYDDSELLIDYRSQGTIANVLKELDAMGEDIVLVGYPTGTAGSGFRIQMIDELSICASGQNQDAAWDFLKYVLGYDYQYAIGLSQSAIRLDAFHARTENSKNFAWVTSTEDEFDTLVSQIFDANVRMLTCSPIKEIILEEAEAFWAGDKTVEETASLIQSRVQIYLGEQS